MDVSVASIDPILNVDKEYIGSFSADAGGGVLGAGGGSNPINPNAEYQAIVPQFKLDSGSVGSYLGVAVLSATAPFVVAYILLTLHQVWLRYRVIGKPHPVTADAREDTTVGTKPGSTRCSGCIGHYVATMLLLAGVLVTIIVVVLPIVVFEQGEPEVLPKFEEEVTFSCTGCINGVPTAEYLEASPITTNSRQVRATLMTQAVRVRRDMYNQTREREKERSG